MTQDYIDRLNSAIKALDQLMTEAAQAQHDSEVGRLAGKREGVQLALSYALEEQRADQRAPMPEQTYPVTFWRYSGQYTDEWTLATIRFQHDDGDCSIESVEGVPVDEWLAARDRCVPACNGTWPHTSEETPRPFHVRDCPNDPARTP